METKYKVLLIVLITYILIVFFIFFLYNNGNTKNYMVLSTNDVYEYKNGYVEKVKISSMKKVKKMKFYLDGKMVGSYPIKIKNTITVDSDNVELIGFSNTTTIGITEKKKLKIYPFYSSYMTSSEITEMMSLLETFGVTGYDSLSISKKINFENTNEVIYLISNAFIEETHDKMFSFIYYKNEFTSQVLYKKIVDTNQALETCIPFVNNLVDWNQDGEIDIILGCQYFDQLGSVYDFLEKKEGTYQSILK